MPNDRRRAMLRLTGDWDQYHPPFKNACPCCFRKVYTQDYRDELGIVESITECKSCGYKDHDFYGCTELNVGDFSERFDYTIKNKEILCIYGEFERAILKHRKKFRAIRRKAYRKNAGYRKEKG